MNQETIENYIKNLGKQDFDGVASLIVKKVFGLVAIDIDGKGDGGSDFRVFNDSGGNCTISIQKTAQDSGWKKKLLMMQLNQKKNWELCGSSFLPLEHMNQLRSVV